MRIAVYGAGAVGGYFGGRLAQAGEDVVFIARGAHLEAMRRDGLRVDSVGGDFRVGPVQAYDTTEAVGTVDAVLVCVKGWQVADAAERMRPMIGPDTLVVPLLNGVEAPDQLTQALGPERVLGGLCKISASRVGPGHIRHGARDPYLAFGAMDNRPDVRAERLRKTFAKAAGVTCEIPPDIRAEMWKKFLSVSSFSGVGAVTRAPIGILRSLPETRRMLEDAMGEVLAVGRAKGVALSDDLVEKTLSDLDRLPPGGTTSMQRDILQGRPSELESQNGAAVRIGNAVGVDTPLHRFIYQSLLPLEMKARKTVSFEFHLNP